MWHVFASFASPKEFYVRTQLLTQWAGIFASVFFSIGGGIALMFSPVDYQQGDTVRIMYLHVPCAFLSMGCFFAMGVLSVLLLVWRIKLAGILLRSFAKIGALLTGLTLITGSLWGKPMWGTWWVWDARLTSEFILWMLYLAILAIQSSFRQRESADQAMAVVALVGLIDLPIIHYSVYWWSTLHQGSSFPLGQKPLIDAAMLWPLGLMLMGFMSFTLWAVLQFSRLEILQRSLKMSWVETLL